MRRFLFFCHDLMQGTIKALDFRNDNVNFLALGRRADDTVDDRLIVKDLAGRDRRSIVRQNSINKSAHFFIE